MTTVYDVPADLLIKRTADKLKGMSEIQAPEWALYVKTGRHKERPPTEKDWWHTRVAAVLRKVYLKGPIGTERLASMFGGAADRGSKPDRAVKGSGSIIRQSLQQLEKAKLVQSLEKKGRMVTPEGRKFLDNIAHEIKMELGKENPELMKY
jgi:small subunit ribosomal protein S19e